MAASHENLVRPMAHDKGTLSTSLKGLEAKALVTITPTPGGRAEAVDLTCDRRNRVASLTASCDSGYLPMNIHPINYTDVAVEG